MAEVEIIDLDTWDRKWRLDEAKKYHRHAIDNCTIQMDCTRIYELSREAYIPFQGALPFFLMKGFNRFKCLRTRLILDQIACYDSIGLASAELDSNENLFNTLVGYTPDINVFYKNYKNCRTGRRVFYGIKPDCICYSALPYLRITSMVRPDTIFTVMGCQMLTTGRMEAAANGRRMIPVSISFNHTLQDGNDYVKLSRYLENEVELNDDGKQ